MKALLFFLGALSFTINLFGQVGIGTTTPSRAAMLEVSSQTNAVGPYKGVMPPRVPNIAARDAINAGYVDFGLLVFVVDNGNGEGCLQIWDGDSWADISCITLASPVAWINEFHYDNIGIDVDEFIEIAGPAGLDLSTFSIELYSGGTSKQYSNTIFLSGIIPDQSNGIGTLSFNTPGLQNGPSDGFALIDSGIVLQFLSYEGTLTATDGTANGMTSIDVGVRESNSTTPLGHSLQLKGSGIQYSHFTWNEPSVASPGSINIGQTID